MKSKPIHRSVLHSALAICVLSAFPTLLRAEAIYDSFDYPADTIELPLKPNSQGQFDSGAGWEQAQRVGWIFGLWGNVEDHGGQVTYQIAHPESLQAPEMQAKQFLSTGGRFANIGTELNISAWRKIDVESGPLAHASLPASTDSENPGRSEAGIGAGGKVIWLAGLMVTGEEKFGAWLKLVNIGGGGVSGNGGLVFHVNGRNSMLSVEQDWSVLNRMRKNVPGRASEFISISPDETFLLVAKIQCGPDWGGDTPFATKDANTFDPETTPTDGMVTVWINPDLTSEPAESAATVQVPIFEFRFSAVAVRLAPGAAIDELRLAPTFDQLLLK